MHTLYCPSLLLNLNFLKNYQISFFALDIIFLGNYMCMVPTQIQRSSKIPNKLWTLMKRMTYIKLIETETMRTTPTVKKIYLGKDKITDSVYKPIILKSWFILILPSIVI